MKHHAPMLITKTKAAQLLGVDPRTLSKNKDMLDRISIQIGDKKMVVRDLLLKELKIV